MQLGACPRHAVRHKALPRRQHRVRVGLGTHAPQQAVGFEPRAATVRAFGVTAVLGQQHPDVHLVGLALQVVKETLNAVPTLRPVAVPIGRTVQHPMALRVGELRPRGVKRNASRCRVAQQVALAFLVSRGLNRFDGPLAQRQLPVGHHQPPVHADGAAKTPARGTSAHRRVERKHRRQWFGVVQIAFGAMQAGGKPPTLGFGRVAFCRCGGQGVHRKATATAFEAQLNRLHRPRRGGARQAEAVCHHVQHAHAAAGRTRLHPFGLHAGKTAGRQPLLDIVGRGAGGQFHRKRHHQARVTGLRGAALQLGVNGLGGVVAHRQRGLAVKQLGRTGQQQLEVVVELRHGAHGRTRRAHRVRLVDGNGRGHALHLVHRRFVHAVQKLARVGAEGFDVAALAFGKQGVKHQAGLARTAGAGHHRPLAGADVHIQIFQVVLACAPDADHTGGVGHHVQASGDRRSFRHLERGPFGGSTIGGSSP